MEQFFQQLTNGLAVGGIYALIALGYTMVYGVLKLINFAHGDLFTIGAYLGLTLLTSLALTDHVGGFLGVGLLALMVMGLVGIILASIVNIFLKSSGLYWMISGIGVLVFVGLTAYDVQKIKDIGEQGIMEQGEVAIQKGAIIGALALYLDFINLFLMLLRFFGGSRD